MIELIILDGRNFNVKDFAYSQDYTIILDSLVVNNVSTFKVNKENLNAFSNDILVTRNKNDEDAFVGIIDSVNIEKNFTQITAYQFVKKLDFTYVDKTKDEINIGDYLKNKIIENLVRSSDTLQNVNFLEVENKCTQVGTIVFQENKATNLLTTLQTLHKTYPFKFQTLISFNTNGTFKGIKIVIKDVDKKIIVKEKENFITNVKVVDGRIGMINKLTYLPNSQNVLYKEIQNYYLLSDGTITQESGNLNRIIPVVQATMYYQDSDVYYSSDKTLLDKAKEKFANTTYNHYINLSVNKNNALPITDFQLGDRVLFIDRMNKVYNTLITKITYSSVGAKVDLEMGLNRISLTDKLSLKERM